MRTNSYIILIQEPVVPKTKTLYSWILIYTGIKLIKFNYNYNDSVFKINIRVGTRNNILIFNRAKNKLVSQNLFLITLITILSRKKLNNTIVDYKLNYIVLFLMIYIVFM